MPLYYKKQFGFRELGKQFSHLIYWKEKIKGNKVKPSWGGTKKLSKNDKLLQKTIYMREHPTKNKKIRDKYIKDLREYLNKLK